MTFLPLDFTILTAVRLLGDDDRWATRMPPPQRLSTELLEEGRAIPVARVQAMHEGKTPGTRKDVTTVGHHGDRAYLQVVA